MIWRRLGVFSIFVLAAASASALEAQTTATVTGMVTGEDGGIAAAQVMAVPVDGDGRFGAVADDAGHYTIASLRPGVYRIEVQALGHDLASAGPIELSAGETEIVNLTLTTAPIALEGVEVTGVGREQFEETYAVTRVEASVTGGEATEFNPANSYDALRLVPGVTYASGNRFSSPIRIRGASSWTTASVIEDFPSVREAGIGAEDGGFTAGFGATIPGIALAGIEVKKGSLGVLYGGGADGGVVVNQLPRGTADGFFGASVETSPMGETLVMGDAGTATGAFDIYAAGKLLAGDYDDYGDERGRVLASDDLASGLLRAGWEPFDGGRFEFIGVAGRDQIYYDLPQRDDSDTEVDESVTLDPLNFRTRNTSGFYGATFDHAVSADLGYELGYSLFKQRALRFSITEDAAHRDRPETSNTAFGNVYLNGEPLGLFTSSVKAGFEWTHHRQAEEADGSTKNQTFEDRSVFLATTAEAGDLTLSGGARHVLATDDFTQDQSFWLHDLGAAYDVDATGTRFVTSWSTGYSRFKGFAYFFGDVSEAGGYEVARTATVEGSIQQQIPSPWNVPGSVTATVFRLDTEGIPIFAGSGIDGVITQDTRATGLELAATYPLGTRASIAGSFSWQDSEVVATDHPNNVQVGNTKGWIPRNTAALALTANPLEALELSAFATYDAGRRRQTVDPVTDDISVATASAYTRLNASAKWQFLPSLGLRVRMENILDEEDLGYTVQTLAPDGSLTTEDTVAVDPGRIIFVGFEFRHR